MQSATYPKISIITIVRNGAQFIEQCLLSVIQQDYDNIEYIVFDGDSSDGTQDIILKHAAKIALFRSEKDKGAYDASAQALQHVTGDIVGFVMADDWLANSHALSTIAEMYANNPQADMFCFGMQEYVLDAGGNKTPGQRYCDPDGTHFTLLDGMYCQGVNRFYSAHILKEEGYFNETQYPNLADRDLYMRMGKRNLVKAWTDKVLYCFLVHAGSNSTGGSAGKRAHFLDETARIAADYRADPSVPARYRNQLTDWYCFNIIRSVWFTLRAGDAVGALTKAMRLCLRHPVRTLRNIVCWKMPAAYRGKAG